MDVRMIIRHAKSMMKFLTYNLSINIPLQHLKQ